MNSYRDYIDEQERSYMTEDEKLEKRNTEIIKFYKTAVNNYRQETPENTSKSENSNMRYRKNYKMRKW